MAGTRCANPEYQMDVDTMMVEYVLYQNVETHLKLLTQLSKWQASEESDDISHIAERAVSALRLTEMYECE